MVILYPFAAILSAEFINNELIPNYKSHKIINYLPSITLLALGLSISFYVNINQFLIYIAATIILCAIAQKKLSNTNLILILPTIASCSFYLILAGIDQLKFERYSIPYNLTNILSNEPKYPIYFQSTDEIVIYETNLYTNSPTFNLGQKNDITKIRDDNYFLVLSNWTPSSAQSHEYKNIGEFCWIEHKTGLFARTLRMAKGIEPCVKYDIYKVFMTQKK
jgi:hypothetical protein